MNCDVKNEFINIRLFKKKLLQGKFSGGHLLLHLLFLKYCLNISWILVYNQRVQPEVFRFSNSQISPTWRKIFPQVHVLVKCNSNEIFPFCLTRAAWKVPVFGGIQSKCGKKWIRITPNTVTFYEVPQKCVPVKNVHETHSQKLITYQAWPKLLK